MTTLDHVAYPHIFAAIIAEATFPVLSTTGHIARRPGASRVTCPASWDTSHILPTPVGPSGPRAMAGSPDRVVPTFGGAHRRERSPERPPPPPRECARRGHRRASPDRGAGSALHRYWPAGRAVTGLRVVRVLPSAVGSINVGLEAEGHIDLSSSRGGPVIASTQPTCAG